MTTSTSASFHVLAKPTGAICNLDCKYCFSLSKEEFCGTVFVQMFDAALASWVGAPPSLCIFYETCGDALALEHNGDVYSCDHFVAPKYLLGAAKRDTLPKYCRECPVRFACHGECPKNRFINTPDGEPGLNYLCAGYRAYFTHIDRPMRMMSQLLRQGRYADEVMQLLTAERRAS